MRPKAFSDWLRSTGKEVLNEAAYAQSRSFVRLVTVTAYLESDTSPRSVSTPLILSGYQWGDDVVDVFVAARQDTTRLRLCFVIGETEESTHAVLREIENVASKLNHHQQYVVIESPHTSTEVDKTIVTIDGVAELVASCMEDLLGARKGGRHEWIAFLTADSQLPPMIVYIRRLLCSSLELSEAGALPDPLMGPLLGGRLTENFSPDLGPRTINLHHQTPPVYRPPGVEFSDKYGEEMLLSVMAYVCILIMRHVYDTVIDHRLYYALVATLSRIVGLYHGMLLR